MSNSLFASRIPPQAKIKHVTASADRPLWRVNLQSLGYPSDNSQFQLRRGLDKFNTVDFLSESVVAATFRTREAGPALQRRDDPNRARPYKLHTIFIEAPSGKVLKTMDWPLDNTVGGIFPRSDGSFLFFSTDHIVLYSADWTIVKELSLPQLQGSASALGGIAQSPSGKSLVVQFRRGTSTLCLRIRTDTLDSSESPCEILELFTASDEGVAAPSALPEGNLSEGTPPGPMVLYDVSMPDASSDPPGRIQNPENRNSARALCASCVGMPQFVDNNTIVVYTPMRLSITSRTGNLKYLDTLNPKEIWIDELGRPVRSSANGQRFAVAFNTSLFRVDAPTAIRMSTGDMPAAFPDHIDTYDLTTEQWIYTLQIKGTRIQQIWGLALSPSGEKLAIDSGGAIQAYALPPKSSAITSNH
jgi:hypothetical protein